MNIYHISAECYPAAKAGGLADVVGSLPKYQRKAGIQSSVILPYYLTPWIRGQETEVIYRGNAPIRGAMFDFSVSRIDSSVLGFDLYLIYIDNRFDRPGIYIDPWTGHPYWDEAERYFMFQIAALEWLASLPEKPDLIHCHDHHTALVPFMMKEAFRFDGFRETPSVLTIHNGEYQGRYAMDRYVELPAFNLEHLGLLDWEGQMNSLATGIKTAWKVTTVSEGYMQELLGFCHGLESLLQAEEPKTMGILNGIDTDTWNSSTDPLLPYHYNRKTFRKGKQQNQMDLRNQFHLADGPPLISFIGRLVLEKGADLIPDLVRDVLDRGLDVVFLMLGTGSPEIERMFEELNHAYPGRFFAKLEYNESLAHQIYAGSDFILMPSRVEPCGLNQMYAMRYGTIPIVRATGGLADTVKDISLEGGYGLVFDQFSKEEALRSLERALELFQDKKRFDGIRREIMAFDFSWEASAGVYQEMYRTLLKLAGTP